MADRHALGKTIKRCLYCGKLYKPRDIYQKYCQECDMERMQIFRDNRKYKTCKMCRSIFLSVNGAEYCDMCYIVVKNRR